MTKQVPFNKPSLCWDEIKYIRDAVRLGQLAGDGTYTKKCEALLCSEVGAKRALLTHSCTAALEMAALLCNLGPGDEVIMPSFTFVSTANAVALRGATPVFVDIHPETLNIDPVKVAQSVTSATRAIFVVHYAGFPADMDAINAIAREHGLLVVEDAAQAFGSTYKGRPAGRLGDLGAFSFHETKNVISGEGGALVVNSQEMIERAEIIREKGTNRSQFFRGQVDKYTWVDLGSSYLPGELIAAFLYAQLEVGPAIRNRRLSIFNAYWEAFEPFAAEGRVGLPKIPADTVGNGHMFYLLLPDQATRARFIASMRAKAVDTPFHYVPLHSSVSGRKYGKVTSELPVTDRIAETLVRLPMFFDLGSDIETVIATASHVLRDI